MIANQHNTHDGKKIVSVCDSELMGQIFEDNNLQLDLTSNFYKGKELDEKSIFEMFKGCYLAIFIGNNSVKFGIKKKIVDKSKIIKIKDIPFAQVMFLI